MNTLETGFLIIVLSVLLMLAGYFMGGTGGMILALFFSSGMNFFAYWYSDKLALRMTGA
jgi:heat shock protein HtpX